MNIRFGDSDPEYGPGVTGWRMEHHFSGINVKNVVCQWD